MLKVIKTLIILSLCITIFTGCNKTKDKQIKANESMSRASTAETTTPEIATENSTQTEKIELIFPEPKNQLEKAINLTSDWFNNPKSSCSENFQEYLYDFDGDDIPEFLKIQRSIDPWGEVTWCQWNIDSLLGEGTSQMGVFITDIDENDCVKMTKYYDKENDQYFYITGGTFELPHRTYTAYIYKHIVYNDGVYSQCITENYFYCKNDNWDFYYENMGDEDDKWYLSTNKVNGKDLGGIGFVEDTEIDGKPCFYDAYQKYISQYEFIEEITFEPSKEPELEKFLKDYDKKFSASATRQPISLYANNYTPKGKGISYDEWYPGMKLIIEPSQALVDNDTTYDEYTNEIVFEINNNNPDFSILKRFPNVSKLSFRYNPQDENILLDLKGLNQFPQITSLNLCGEENIDLESFSKLKYIDSLTIDGMQFENLEFLSDMQPLRVLYIIGKSYTKENYYKPLYNLNNFAVIDISQVAGDNTFSTKQKENIKEHIPNIIIVNSCSQS